jgi:hypothetical protein
MSKAELDTFNLFDINFNAFFLQPLNPSAGSTVTKCINPKTSMVVVFAAYEAAHSAEIFTPSSQSWFLGGILIKK